VGYPGEGLARQDPLRWTRSPGTGSGPRVQFRLARYFILANRDREEACGYRWTRTIVVALPGGRGSVTSVCGIPNFIL
jgi:hypothetical protein